MTPRKHTRPTDEKTAARLRDRADSLADELVALAGAIEAGTATERDVYGAIRALSYAYVDIEDSAEDVLDTTSAEVRMMCAARKGLYHMTTGDASAAMVEAHTAAEFAEQVAREE